MWSIVLCFLPGRFEGILRDGVHLCAKALTLSDIQIVHSKFLIVTMIPLSDSNTLCSEDMQ